MHTIRKIIGVALTCSLLCSVLIVQSYAVSVEEELQSALDSAEQYAYLDLNSASTDLQEKILEARKTIIFSQDWVADGFTGYIQDVETGEILKELPSFSSVFPDWDIPILDPVTESETVGNLSPVQMEAEITPLADLDSWLRLGSFSTYLNSASSSNADPFVSFTMDPYSMGTSVRAYATALTSSQTCNIGFSDPSTGVSYISGTYLSPNQAVSLHGLYYTDIAVRASTFSTPGWATIAVDGAYRVTNLRYDG